MNVVKNSKIAYFIVTTLVYGLYGISLGIGLLPCILIIKSTIWMTNNGINSSLMFCGILGLLFYAYLITTLFVFTLIMRILSLGFKPGKYEVNSAVMARWLVYSGFHTLCYRLIMPCLMGTEFVKMHYILMGCKIGKNVFINTTGIHDSYLLEIGDNVVLGGDSVITCHIYEGNSLILGKVVIGNNVLVGAEAYVMPGVTIEDNCSIGTRSIVRRNKTIKRGQSITSLQGLSLDETTKLLKLVKKRKE